jgi:hypothetical protein
MDPELAKVSIVAVISGTVLIGTLAQLWATRRAKMPRADATPPRLEAIDHRLDRLEQAMETVAIEVERIAEAHRFTAKLLADRLPEHQSELPRRTDRSPTSITPH